MCVKSWKEGEPEKALFLFSNFQNKHLTIGTYLYYD
jgi:hypothetical protein